MSNAFFRQFLSSCLPVLLTTVILLAFSYPSFAIPTITSQPVATQTACTGTNVTFSVTATGSGLTYQWRKNGVNIAGATAASYTIVSVTATHAGNYNCVVSDGTPVTSNTSVLTVNTTPAAPAVTSPVSYCQNSTAAQLTATGSNLVWGSGSVITGTAGGTASLGTTTFADGRWGAGAKLNFTTTKANVVITSVDYHITPYQNVTGLILSLYNSTGTIIATSSTNTTFTAGASAVKITNTFNFTLATAGNYSIGFSDGYGNIGADNPTFPITESSGTINLTGVTPAGARLLNNLQFSVNTGSTAPTPSTTTVGSTNYVVTQTVNGCTSPQAVITVIVNAPGTWNGSVSSDWHNASNWCSGIPTATTDVTIPSGSPNSPLLTAGASCRNLTINAGASLGISGNGNLGIGGNFASNGSLNATAGSVTFNGTAAQTISGTANLSFYHFVIAKTAGTGLTFTGSTNNVSTQNLTITSGNFISPATLTVNGNLAINAGNFTSTTGTLNLKGNFLNNSVFSHNNGSINFNGSGLQTISGSSATSFYQLQVNNASNVSLGSNVTVTSSLILTSGKFNLGNYNLIIGSSATLSGYTAARYFIATGTGVLKQNLPSGSSRIFPVGTATSYLPATIAFTAGSTTDQISVRLMPTVLNEGSAGGAVTTNSVSATWMISEEIAGGSNASVTLQWPSGQELPGFNRALCRLAHHVNNRWDYGTADMAAGGSNPYQVTRSGFTSFSPFAVSTFAALPVQWMQVSVKRAQAHNLVQWTTTQETGNKYFEIEFSENGRIYTKAGTVAASNNAGEIKHYSYQHTGATASILYYRIRQVDFSGMYSFSTVMKLAPDASREEVLNCWPNPSTGVLNISFYSDQKGNLPVKFLDISGRELYQEIFSINIGPNLLLLDVNKFLPGTYFIRIPAIKMAARFIKAG